MQRRDVIKLAGAGSIAALSSGTVSGDTVLSYDQTLVTLVGSGNIKPDDRVELYIPEDAANGAVVPVGVISTVPDTLKIVLLVDQHTRSKIIELDTSSPLLAPRLSTHLQLKNACTLTALVHSELGWFSNTAEVKTLGESCET